MVGVLTAIYARPDTVVMSSVVARVIPSSPRKRRRLGWASLALVALAGAAAAVALLPGPPPQPPERFSNEPADVYVPPKPLKLGAGDRRAIGAALESFVQNGLGRRDVVRAYRLATPALRAGVSLADWKRGDLPVFPYEAQPGNGRRWTKDYAYGNTVGFELFLQPGPDERGDRIAFKGEVKRIGGRWLVDSIIPAATFSREGEKARVFANVDFQRGALGSGSESGRLSESWLLLPVGLLALAVLLPLSLFAYRAARKH